MFNLIKRFLMLVSGPVFLSSFALFSPYGVAAPTNSAAGQTRVPQDLSGSYKGRIYFGDKTGDQYIMSGPVTLKINGLEFLLTDHATGKQVKGRIKTAVIPERANLGVGEIEAENDSPIEIRWYRDEARGLFKIVRASGANRVFRFCSEKLTRPQCRGKI